MTFFATSRLLYPFSAQAWEDVVARVTGPGGFRFILQPAAAIFFGIRDGLVDASEGRPPFIHILAFERERRAEAARSALKTLLKPIIVASLVDALSQYLLFHRVHPLVAILVGSFVLALPYSIARALSNRIATARIRAARRHGPGTQGTHPKPIEEGVHAMSDLREYKEGTPFNGVIGRTIADSIPAWPAPLRAKEGAPNVLMIVLDDVGFAWLGCYGSNIDTPNIDRLAQNGLRYTNFHTTALCSPTRTCLITGRNHHSNAMACITEAATGFPGYNGQIPKANGFLSEMLMPQGYANFAIGKWHLTPDEETNMASRKDRWPLGRGFERYYGFLGGETDQWDPDLISDNSTVQRPDRTRTKPYYHNCDDLTDKAIEFLADLKAVAPTKPFFLYYCLGACHAPHHVPREWADKYKGKFDMGWDEWRRQTLERQKQMGIVPQDTELPPREPEVQEWDSLPDDEKRLYTRMMEVYAGYLSYADACIGRLLGALDKVQELENTIVVLVSDNGASAEGGEHGSVNENLFFNMVPDDLQRNLQMLDKLGGPETYGHYPMGWTMAGDTPYRRWKRETFNGGISDPMIVSWPKGIKARGEIRDQYYHAVDVVPTILDILGITPPAEINGVTQTPIEGVSFRHSFEDKDAPTSKPVQYYEMFAQRAVWHDGWKAVCYHPFGQPITEEVLAKEKWDLYRVDAGGPEPADRSETHNLADKYPEKLQAMIERWWAEAGRYNVLPLDGRGQLRIAEPRPQITEERKHYVYFADMSPIPESVAVNVKNVSFNIHTEAEIPDGGADGVIIAHGGRFGGYTFFVKDNRLHYVHNYLGLEQYQITSDREIPSGHVTLGFEFIRTGEHQGHGKLYINGELAGEGDIPHTVPIAYALTGEGLCCGYDSGTPCTDEYESPFTFTGDMKWAVVDISGEPYHNLEREGEIAMAIH